MPQPTRYEQQFTDALKAIFIGAKVEGDSGYINLMRIKATYFEQGVFPQLLRDIEATCKPFEPSFREELFDKLYDFFRRYFSESGSIYFRHTAASEGIYERVYTDDRDVMLFWKTHMLYYVKTDRLFNSMAVTADGEQFFFDVSGMTLKRANEKRELIYEFRRRDPDGRLVFGVAYSEKGRKTKTDEMVAEIRKTGAPVAEETLERAFRVFEKQAEVDYYINHVIRTPSERRFLNQLEAYLQEPDNGFRQYDWWHFSRADETLDRVILPYYDPTQNRIRDFHPDFVFWLVQGRAYTILFVDPKGMRIGDYQYKIDDYSKLFRIEHGYRIFPYGDYEVQVALLMYSDSADRPPEGYQAYWCDSPQAMLQALNERHRNT
jgi:hypothetical protein